MELVSGQLALLDRCRQRGYITPMDVEIVYCFSEPKTYWQSRRLSEIKLQILRSLEIRGYLIRTTRLKWELTKDGISVLEREVVP